MSSYYLCRLAGRLLTQHYREVLPDGAPGFITFVQTFGDLVTFNPHIHVLCADGVFKDNGVFRVLGFGFLRRPTSSIHAVVPHYRPRQTGAGSPALSQPGTARKPERISHRVPGSDPAGRRRGLGKRLMAVLDTHILVWWVNGDNALSAKAKKAITGTLDRGEEIVISSISAWEISMLIQRGRLLLTTDVESWLDQVAQIDGATFYPVDNEIALKSATLPGNFHKDPADRMIVATARKLALPLVTTDKKILSYSHVKTIA